MATNTPKLTLRQIAADAGVSVPTVSKVLNGRADVAESTRRRVTSAIRARGYASPQQRRRAATAPALVDLVTDLLTSAYSVEVMRGIVDVAASEGVEVVISTLSSRQAPSTDGAVWAQRLSAAGRRGLILVASEVDATQLDELRAHGISVVLIDPFSTPQDDVVTLGSTNWAGGRAAVDHLISLGHRRIGYLGGPLGADCASARLHGYHAALADAGITADPAVIRHGPFESATGTEGLAALCDTGDLPTAIFAASDSIAIGVMTEAHRRGIRVPDDLSVVGFDGTPLVDQTVPRLTSVAQPLFEIGATALRTVLRLTRDEPVESMHIELATKLVVRESTAPPRGKPRVHPAARRSGSAPEKQA
ncbi:LacI family DNA-binding transcriptional regulator [Marisediminicola sp. LYQ134]|uniref:LacI family DNA-binding transcriptional regulator n=1 Tax=Marisediminicola sp. LYQ134 TaxID=3391061 RepID=UPI003983AE0E